MSFSNRWFFTTSRASSVAEEYGGTEEPSSSSFPSPICGLGFLLFGQKTNRGDDAHSFAKEEFGGIEYKVLFAPSLLLPAVLSERFATAVWLDDRLMATRMLVRWNRREATQNTPRDVLSAQDACTSCWVSAAHVHVCLSIQERELRVEDSAMFCLAQALYFVCSCYTVPCGCVDGG